MNMKILIVIMAVCVAVAGAAGFLITRQEAAQAGDLPATITSDTTFTGDITMPSGDKTTIRDGAVITVEGSAAIDGTLDAEDGPLVLNVNGDLTINGTLEAIHASPPNPSPTTPLGNQSIGIRIVVGGDLTFGSGARVNTNGHIVITDNEEQLQRTPQEIEDEVDSASGTLPTLVPLPPDHSAFENSNPLSGARSTFPAQAGNPIVLSGDWNFENFPGDTPVVVFRFGGARDLHLNDFDLTGPKGVSGGSDDQSGNPEESAQGSDGKKGMRLNIWNNSGKVKFTNVTLNLSDGGDGGSATAKCSDATGGAGGEPGNLRTTAGGGIEVDSLTINPGKGGNGGNATATCPGHDEEGHDVTATAGNGGNNKKALYVRGNVQGVSNITIGELAAGDGGDATAVGGKGGDCVAPDKNGWSGGDATAIGGNGGDASLSLKGHSVSAGSVVGGDGGDATATGGNGGDGCDGTCPIEDPPGQGGSGGTAAATAGTGGDASGDGTLVPGTDGEETTTDGQDGQDGVLI
jgi:hypothetical protein